MGEELASKIQSYLLFVIVALLPFSVSAATQSIQTPEELISINKSMTTPVPVDNKSIAENNSGFIVDPDFFNGIINNDDVLLKMLSTTIGEPIDQIRSTAFLAQTASNQSSTTLVTKVITSLSTIAALFAAVMITFVMGVSVLQQARTGTFLGKWDSWFVPMRIVGSGALIVPIPKFGFLNGIQVIITVLFIFGIGAANYVSNMVAEYSFTETLIQPEVPETTTTLPTKILLGQICSKYYQGANPGYTIAVKYGDVETKTINPTNTAAVQRVFAKDAIITNITWEATKKEGGSFVESLLSSAAKMALPTSLIPSSNKTPCGTITLTKHFKTNRTTTLGKNAYQKYKESINPNLKTLAQNLEPIAEWFYQKWSNNKKDNTLISVTDNQGKTFDIPIDSNNVPGILKNILKRFNTSLIGSATNIKADIDDFEKSSFTSAMEKMKNGGFTLLGVYYMAISQRQNTLNDIITESSKIDVESTEIEVSDLNLTDKDKKGFFEIKEAYGNIPISTSPIEFTKADIAGGFEGALQKAQSWFIGGMMWIFTRENANGTVDPMITIRSTGNFIVGVAGTLYTLAIFSGGIAESLGLVSLGASSGWSWSVGTALASGLGTIINLLFGIGLIMAVLIPMLPFLMMTMGVIGLVIYYLEALAGSSFWIAYHAHPEGDDFYGKAASGYPIVMTLTLRPLFMVVGFVAGMAIFRVGAQLFQSVFESAFIMATSGGFSMGFSTIIGSIVIYMGFYIVLAYKSFQLTYEFPNFVNRWLGFSDHSDLGEEKGKEIMAGYFAGAGHRLPASGGLDPNAGGGGNGGGGNGGGGNGGGGNGGGGNGGGGSGRTQDKMLSSSAGAGNKINQSQGGAPQGASSSSMNWGGKKLTLQQTKGRFFERGRGHRSI